MNRSFKYRIYPNKAQREAFDDILYFCKDLYNSALEERISSYKRFGKSPSYFDQCGSINGLKNSFTEAEIIRAQTLQAVLRQLDNAYQNFFRRVKSKTEKAGFPRYKSTDRFRSILFAQCNFDWGGVRFLQNDKLKVYGLPGEVKIVYHRPFEGRCKNVRLLKASGDKYYVILCCDEVPLKFLPKTGKEIGIDLGLNNFIATSENEIENHPRPYKASRKKLANLQRKFSKKQKNSNNRKKLKLQISRQFEHITNIRQDFQHKLSKKLIEENDTIIVEKLNIKGMLEAKGFEVNKSNISEASWGSFISKLKYKAERAGRAIIEVNPRNTSKTCSCCGNVKSSLSLKDREYCCEVCSLAIDRDLNAAINIKRLGMSLVANKIASEVSFNT